MVPFLHHKEENESAQLDLYQIVLRKNEATLLKSGGHSGVSQNRIWCLKVIQLSLKKYILKHAKCFLTQFRHQQKTHVFERKRKSFMEFFVG